MTLGDFERVANELIRVKEENQELKKQLEEINKMIEKCGFVNIEQVMLNYCGLLSQKKEFIKFLEDEIKELQKIKETELDYDILKDVIPQLLICKEILQKYKRIIGDDK